MACTPDDVRAITGSDASDEAIQPFIDAAQCIIDGLAGCMTSKGVLQSDQDKACAFLAAHIMSSSKVGQDGIGTKRRETFENYTVEWAMSSLSGQGPLSTSYGQTANLLTRGCLQESYKAPSAVCFFG